jgi:hypothetical protein
MAPVHTQLDTEAPMDFNRIMNGMLRAMRLDKTFFEEVEHDPSYNQDALAVVILVSLVGAIGGFLGRLIAGAGFLSAVFNLIVGVILAIVGYFLWVYVAHYIGTRFFKGQGDVGEVQRTFGFAYSPQILNILAFIPCLGGFIGLIAWLWSAVAGYIAIRQSLDQDDTNALLTVVVSAIVVIVITLIISAIFGLIFGGLYAGYSILTGGLRG